MHRLARLQILGPLAVFFASAGAESAAYALAVDPSSETLWYVNLGLFGVFRQSHYVLSDHASMPGAQLVLIALAIFATAVFALIRERRLALAIASNLSLLYAAFLAFSWYRIVRLPFLQVSSAPVAIPIGPTLCTLSIVLGCALLSFFVSHLLYVAAIRAEA
jgi:hypothetical protein